MTSLSSYSYWSENESTEEDFYDNNQPLGTKRCPLLTDTNNSDSSEKTKTNDSDSSSKTNDSD